MHLALCLTLLAGAAPGEPHAEQPTAAPAATENWPGYLGQGRSGDLRAKSLPLKWTPEKNIAWKAELPGHGQSSPIIWRDRVYVTSVEGPLKDHYFLVAVSLADGRELWRHKLESTDKVKNSFYVSRAAPTPAADSAGVYAFFESGDLVALDHAGTVRWQRSLAKDYARFEAEFGIGSSPAQLDDRLFLLLDHAGPSYLLAVDKATGKTLWKTERASRQSWSSPAIVEVAGKPQVVCSSAGSVDGYDPATGKLLWRIDSVGGNTVATPLPVGPGRCLISASPGRGGENAEAARQSNLLLEIVKTEDGFEPRVKWRSTKVNGSFSSPILHNGRAYWLNSAGVVFCLDADSGEQLFAQRLEQPAWATPLAVEDRIYYFGKRGLTTVLAAADAFQELAENQLWDPDAVVIDESEFPEESDPRRRAAARNFAGPTVYGVAAVEGSLLIRIGETLYCLRGGGD